MSQVGPSKEHIVHIKLWTTKGNVSRKNAPPRKPSSDRRNSLSNQNLSNDDKTLKEKPSWRRNYSNNSTSIGYWRTAACKLSEDGENVILNLYVDETILQHSVYVNLLRCTDIRPAHHSLFFSADCLGIHAKAGQRLLDMQFNDAIYIIFSDSDLLSTWLALLRSYAIPETYGRLMAPETGGLYRMWRQVDLYIAQGRNIGILKAINESSPRPHYLDADFFEVLETDTYCEIYINSVLSGRTTMKKNLGAPEWHEQFEFGDLPPFRDLVINLFRERKAHRPQLVGFIQIDLSTFRRGELVDGWFPIVSREADTSGTQAGELRLKLKMDEEIILPGPTYTSLMQVITSRNMLDLLSTLEYQFKLQHISNNFMAVAVAKNVLIQDVVELAYREIGDSTRNSRHTLFRGNTMLTKTTELAMSWYGKKFLEASVGSAIRRLYVEKVAIEVDPIKNGKGTKDLEKNAELLAFWCGEFWTQIYSVRTECPNELRQLFHRIRILVESHHESTDNTDFRWQSVSAFCFLRFIVPAILHPHLFNLCPGLPSSQIQRSLTLIAKVLQGLANLKSTTQKDDFMKPVSVFTQQNLLAMKDYLDVVSTPFPSQRGHVNNRGGDAGDRIHIMSSLRERASYISTLHNDAISPHMSDIPKHLAILSSAAVRNARKLRAKLTIDLDPMLNSFLKECLKVERQALQCVTLLAPRQPWTANDLKADYSIISDKAFASKLFKDRTSSLTAKSDSENLVAISGYESKDDDQRDDVTENGKTQQDQDFVDLKHALKNFHDPGSIADSSRDSMSTGSIVVAPLQDNRKAKGFLRGFLSIR